MYPKKRPKSDRERFLEAFHKKVGTAPDIFLRRRIEAGEEPATLKALYDQLALEIAQKAHCTAIRFDEAQYALKPAPAKKIPASRVCPRCGQELILRTGMTGARKGQKYWGCTGYPACRYTKNLEENK